MLANIPAMPGINIVKRDDEGHWGGEVICAFTCAFTLLSCTSWLQSLGPALRHAATRWRWTSADERRCQHKLSLFVARRLWRTDLSSSYPGRRAAYI